MGTRLYVGNLPYAVTELDLRDLFGGLGTVTDAKIVTDLRNQNPAFQGASAAKFTYLSAAHYCPKYITGEDRGPKPEGAVGN